MKYDIATKAIIRDTTESILKKLLGIDFSSIEETREIPEETVNLKRSDFPFQITGKKRSERDNKVKNLINTKKQIF